MFMYLVAGTVQLGPRGRDVVHLLGLPAGALTVAAFAPRRPGERQPPRSARPAAPHPAHVLGALLVVPAITAGARKLLDWQMEVLPIPGGAADLGLGSLDIPGGVLGLVFFLSVSPGIMEELLFRGALLEGMKRDWRWPRILGWRPLLRPDPPQHLRLADRHPGRAAGSARPANQGVVPAILVHITYNGLTVLGGRAEEDPRRERVAHRARPSGGLVRPCAVGRDPGARSSRSSVAPTAEACSCGFA